MLLARIYVLEGQYDEARLIGVSAAIQDSLINILKVPSADFCQITQILSRSQFQHTPSLVDLECSDELIVLELTFISDRPKETRLALFRELNERIVAYTGISADDLLIQLYAFPAENISFGQGLGPPAFVSEPVSET